MFETYGSRVLIVQIFKYLFLLDRNSNFIISLEQFCKIEFISKIYSTDMIKLSTDNHINLLT